MSQRNQQSDNGVGPKTMYYPITSSNGNNFNPSQQSNETSDQNNLISFPNPIQEVIESEYQSLSRSSSLIVNYDGTSYTRIHSSDLNEGTAEYNNSFYLENNDNNFSSEPLLPCNSVEELMETWNLSIQTYEQPDQEVQTERFFNTNGFGDSVSAYFNNS